MRLTGEQGGVLSLHLSVPINVRFQELSSEPLRANSSLISSKQAQLPFKFSVEDQYLNLSCVSSVASVSGVI